YITLKRSSLVLVDSWENPQLTEKIKEIISNDFKNEDVTVKNVMLRSSGMVDQAEIHIEADGDERLSDIELLSLQIEMAIRSKYPSLEKISIIPHSSSDSVDKSKLTRINTLRTLIWKPQVFRTDKKTKVLK
ncbi:MAG: cation transporter dimerization domain-containing protein, partial [Nitrososphaeraceae archaeon]|nr:cation transporter dimerization domain-containing protein [Nitrososphaeraceae archaeon]